MNETANAAAGARHVVIVGGGPAAHRLADSLHARDAERRLRVTVVGEERWAPYDRVALSTRLADGDADLTLPDSPWDDGHVRLLTGERVVEVSRATRTAVTDSGLELRWDDLVLATGSSAPVPDLPGAEHAR
ncbi:MAG TPA: FAD-dependent oxidoreductase, partial [Agromyces sp.]